MQKTHGPDPRLSPDGAALLLRIADHIEAHAEHFDMLQWFGAKSWERNPDGKSATVNACGTAACIGGWAILLAHGVEAPEDIPRVSAPMYNQFGPSRSEISERVLHAVVPDAISTEREAAMLLFTEGHREYYDIKSLFYVSDWPYEFRRQYEKLHDDRPVAAAIVAADYIRLFVKTDGNPGRLLSDEDMHGPDHEVNWDEENEFDAPEDEDTGPDEDTLGDEDDDDAL